MKPEKVITDTILVYGSQVPEGRRRDLQVQLLLAGGDTSLRLARETESVCEAAYRLALVLEAPDEFVLNRPSLHEVGKLLLSKMYSQNFPVEEKGRRIRLSQAVDDITRRQ